MDGYEKLLKIISNLNTSTPNTYLTTMESASSCRVGDLLLESEDFLIAEHLKTGYVKKIIQSDGAVTVEYAEPLKQDDMVILMKLNNKKYAILERVV